jgi:hypothetical protein
MAEEITKWRDNPTNSERERKQQAGRVRTVKACDCDGDDDENRCVGSDLGERRGRIQTFMCRGCEGQTPILSPSEGSKISHHEAREGQQTRMIEWVDPN